MLQQEVKGYRHDGMLVQKVGGVNIFDPTQLRTLKVKSIEACMDQLINWFHDIHDVYPTTIHMDGTDMDILRASLLLKCDEVTKVRTQIRDIITQNKELPEDKQVPVPDAPENDPGYIPSYGEFKYHSIKIKSVCTHQPGKVTLLYWEDADAEAKSDDE
jgi:hypothetical protein